MFLLENLSEPDALVHWRVMFRIPQRWFRSGNPLRGVTTSFFTTPHSPPNGAGSPFLCLPWGSREVNGPGYPDKCQLKRPDILSPLVSQVQKVPTMSSESQRDSLLSALFLKRFTAKPPVFFMLSFLWMKKQKQKTTKQRHKIPGLCEVTDIQRTMEVW